MKLDTNQILRGIELLGGISRAETLENKWKDSYSGFHHTISFIQPIIDNVYDSNKISNSYIIDFIIKYLEVDPIYFRSGYEKEMMLEKLVKSELSNY